MSHQNNRQYESGAAKRRKVREEQQKIEQLPKISTFFAKTANKPQCNADHSAIADIDLATHSCEENLGGETSSVANAANECTSVYAIGEIANDEDSNNYKCDPASWKINENMVRYWVKKGPCQNTEQSFEKSVREFKDGSTTKKRSLTNSAFKRELPNGEKVNREWLLYSPSQGTVYCFACRLFSAMETSFSKSGFSDWKHVHKMLKEHENSVEHRACMLTYLNRQKTENCIDSKLSEQFEKEKNYWKNVLNIVVSVIKFLTARGLPFRGSSDKFSDSDNGHYLGILELISEHNLFLKNHIDNYGNLGRGNVNYLSKTICEELVEIMAKKVISLIVCEIKSAKYYAITVDSTPDISHTDQLTFVLRYLKKENIIERFIEFIPIKSHDGNYLATVVLNMLEKHQISICDCRGQSYDNAPNMSGCYNGLQAKLKELCSSAVYVPCAAHSLNLVGVHSVLCCTKVISFFEKIQKLYTFFSSSTYRWEVLISLGLLKVPKTLSATRWSARADALLAVRLGYLKFIDALEIIIGNEKQPAETKYEATCLVDAFKELDNAFLTIFWSEILQRINETSEAIQKINTDLSVVIDLLKSLESFIESLRSKFDEFEEKAKELTDCDYTDCNKRKKRISSRLSFFDGPSNTTVLEGRDKFRVEVFIPVIDKLCSELTRRSKEYVNIFNRFGFISNLLDTTDEDIDIYCKNLCNFYPVDLDQSCIASEFIHFKLYLSPKADKTKELGKSIRKMYELLHKDNIISVFPNVEIAMRIFLTILPTNCSGERSFSRLSLIKDEHRSTMTQKKLNEYSVMCIENDLLKSIEFEEIIDEFVSRKVRRKCIL